jgi:hypothetical protein
VIQTTPANGSHTDTISTAIAIQGNGGTASFTAGATSPTSILSIGAITGVSTTTAHRKRWQSNNPRSAGNPNGGSRSAAAGRSAAAMAFTRPAATGLHKVDWPTPACRAAAATLWERSFARPPHHHRRQ